MESKSARLQQGLLGPCFPRKPSVLAASPLYQGKPAGPLGVMGTVVSEVGSKEEHNGVYPSPCYLLKACGCVKALRFMRDLSCLPGFSRLHAHPPLSSTPQSPIPLGSPDPTLESETPEVFTPLPGGLGLDLVGVCSLRSEPQGSHLTLVEPKPSPYTPSLTLGSLKAGRVGCKAGKCPAKPSQSGLGGGCRAPPHHPLPCPGSLHTTP